MFSGVDPVDDGLIRSGLTLFYAPSLSPHTYLVTSIDANLIRYANLSDLSYNELRFRAGVLQRLSPRMFGEIGWSNQQLFTASRGVQDLLGGKKFLDEHSLRIELNRQDPITPHLSLNTFYQFRWALADPEDRSRVINSLITSLSYNISPSFLAAFDYQFSLTNFTHQDRVDVYHQALLRLGYTPNSNSQLNVFGGFSFGRSSNTAIDFDGFIFGVGLVINLPLF